MAECNISFRQMRFSIIYKNSGIAEVKFMINVFLDTKKASLPLAELGLGYE
jgi:hypothetical protein